MDRTTRGPMMPPHKPDSGSGEDQLVAPIIPLRRRRGGPAGHACDGPPADTPTQHELEDVFDPSPEPPELRRRSPLEEKPLARVCAKVPELGPNGDPDAPPIHASRSRAPAPSSPRRVLLGLAATAGALLVAFAALSLTGRTGASAPPLGPSSHAPLHHARSTAPPRSTAAARGRTVARIPRRRTPLTGTRRSSRASGSRRSAISATTPLTQPNTSPSSAGAENQASQREFGFER